MVKDLVVILYIEGTKILTTNVHVSREKWQSNSQFDARDTSCFVSLMQSSDAGELKGLSEFVRDILRTLERV